RPGRFDAADHLDDDVDVRIADDGLRVVGEHAGTELDVSFLRDVVHGNAGDLDGHAGALGNEVRVGLQRLHQRRADIAAPEYSYSHHSHRHSLADGTPGR